MPHAARPVRSPVRRPWVRLPEAVQDLDAALQAAAEYQQVFGTPPSSVQAVHQGGVRRVKLTGPSSAVTAEWSGRRVQLGWTAPLAVDECSGPVYQVDAETLNRAARRTRQLRRWEWSLKTLPLWTLLLLTQTLQDAPHIWPSYVWMTAVMATLWALPSFARADRMAQATHLARQGPPPAGQQAALVAAAAVNLALWTSLLHLLVQEASVLQVMWPAVLGAGGSGLVYLSFLLPRAAVLRQADPARAPTSPALRAPFHKLPTRLRPLERKLEVMAQRAQAQAQAGHLSGELWRVTDLWETQWPTSVQTISRVHAVDTPEWEAELERHLQTLIGVGRSAEQRGGDAAGRELQTHRAFLNSLPGAAPPLD